METKQAELFKVLGVESRIKIIELLKQKGPLGANEMSEILGITPSAVSQHLKILKHAGLVRNERKGYWIPYEINPAALEKCGDLLSSICTCGCEGTGKFREAELEKSGDKVALLRKYERELEEEIKKVRAQIETLE
ncbi:MAG: winged helix-turn-helix transcriptional regulator [Desulfobacterales bacterium]|uniref:Winged helix-turn-helix transcriptional regulator n=1 Tax=Candidatus Desulfatibia profunda TaxID=2841695 RepID=A0A8J6NSC2_9BACT|nr:winged helix-turn-helix transcriptional regulator [Candidatus Desulfatibia profunda]MBL7178602.1 winged helix-turn-helix transcriptional regulator [Desulfobacterales bacterium]